MATCQTIPFDQNQSKARALNAMTGMLMRKKTPTDAQGLGLNFGITLLTQI